MSRLILATEALANGALNRRELHRNYRKVHRNVYAPRDMELSAQDKAEAAWLWSGRTAIVCGLSAAALLGSRWVPISAPAELVRAHPQSPTGIVVHRDTVPDDEIRQIGGIDCTTAARTAFDLGRRLPFVDGLIRVDALLNATHLPVAQISALAAQHPGARHITRLRKVLTIADGGAASPQESRVRFVLVRGGLPRPETQIPVGWRSIDMGWPQWKVGVEYDGVQHWDDPRQFGSDIERRELFAELGWRIVHVVADHLRDNPQGIVARSARALRAAGWQGELVPPANL